MSKIGAASRLDRAGRKAEQYSFHRTHLRASFYRCWFTQHSIEADLMLCTRCGERDAVKVIVVEGVPENSPPRTSLEERRHRADRLSRLCERCLVETTVPPELRAQMQALLDEQQRMYAAATAEPPSDRLLSLLDTMEKEALRDPVDVALMRGELIALLQYLGSVEGRTLSNVHATSDRLSRASNWTHLPAPYPEILQTLSGSTLQAVWEPATPSAKQFLPEQLLARLQIGPR